MDLLDAYGRPVITTLLKEEQAAPTLAGIRNIFSIIDTSIGLTPEKAVGILRTAEFGDPWLYLELAERMEEKHLLYQGVLHTRKMAVSQLDIDINAADDSAEAVDDADFIRDILIDSNIIDLHDVIFDMLDALGKGFSVTEILWNTDGRNIRSGAPQWLPADLKWRDPRWFLFDWISGEQLLVRTLKTEGPQIPVGRDSWDNTLSPINFRIRPNSTGQEIGIQPASAPLAPFKFITHITRAKAGLAIRGGLARIAIWTYLFANYVLKDWVTFAEVYGQPMRLGKYSPGATENDRAALLRAVANIGTDAAAIIPDSMAIEFVESKGGGQKSHEMYQKFCEYLDKLLTIGILGQELTTQLPHGAGSRAAAQVHDVVRRDIATDDARRVSATLNRDLIKPLIDLNRGPRYRYPSIMVGFKQNIDLMSLMDAAGPAIDRGMKVSMKWLREQFNIPDPENGDELLHPIERITAQEGGGGGSSGPPGAEPPASEPKTAAPKPAAPPSPPAAAGAISDVSLAPAYTGVNGQRHVTATMAGNPEAVGPALRERGGSEIFRSAVRSALSALPTGCKRLLKGWTVITVPKAGGEWVGLTDPQAQTIKLAEERSSGEIVADPAQVLRHEVGHAAAVELQQSVPEWWKAWYRAITQELAGRYDKLQTLGFGYLFKSDEEAFAELFSYELAHPPDPEDKRYAQLQQLLPQSYKLMQSFTRSFGQVTAAATPQKKSLLHRWLLFRKPAPAIPRALGRY